MQNKTRLSLALAWLFIVGLSVSTVARPYRRRYKYYLDANRAEEVLAGIALRPRLGEDDWLKILGDRQMASITIQPGDTLWDLSSRSLKDPFLWRKLWEENPFLTNPHELEPGEVLQYYREGDDSANVIRIPLVKLLPDIVGQAADLDNDSLINLDIKNHFRPMILVLTESEILGEVTGSYGDNEGIGDLDKVYGRFRSMEGVKKGARFAIVRKERTLKTKTVGGVKVDGMLMRLVAEVRVVRVGEKFVELEIMGEFNPLYRGDKIAAAVPAVQWTALFDPPEGLTTKITAGEAEEYGHYAQGQLVLLDKGSAEGVKNGYLFRVYRDTDPVTETHDGVPPDYKAEVQVVYTGKLSSVAYILRNSVPLSEGDVCVPAQDFPNPPPPVVPAHQVLELP